MTESIRVRERGRVALPELLVEVTPTEFWSSAGCKVTRAAGDQTWTLEAGDSVGIARLVTPKEEVLLQVTPKLDAADVFFLADYAYEQRHDPLRLLEHGDVGLEALLRDPSACLLAWHARAIHRFAARWLRRGYRRVDRVLDGKIKGRPLIGRYLARHMALGDPARIPCRLQERTQDTANNRLLKAGLRYIVSASKALPVPAARKAVMREAEAALPLFAHVSDITVSPSDLREASSRGPLRHYKGVLAATTALLQGKLMGTEPTDSQTITSFMWDMPTLFQEALRGVIDSTPDLSLTPGSIGSARIYDAVSKRVRSTKVDPDMVLSVDGRCTLVLDTKYKDALPNDHERDGEFTLEANRRRVKVSRADIYQIVAYTHHEKWKGAVGSLLFPTVLVPGDILPDPLRVEGFDASIWLMFVDIGPNAAVNLPRFEDAVRSLMPQVWAAA